MRWRGAADAPQPPRDRDRLIEPLVAEARKGDARPRYCLVAGGGGHVAPFSPVARLIDATWHGLGVLDPALFDEDPAIQSIEDLAKRMALAIRSVDPDGPYLLARHSAGGRTVPAIARQLRCGVGEAGCALLDAGAGSQGVEAERRRYRRISHRRHGGPLRHRVAVTDTPVALVRAVGVGAEPSGDRADHGWPRAARLVAMIDTPGDR